MISENEIKEVAIKLGTAISAQQIILFGSYARGNATNNSDVDLLFVAESSLPRFKRSRVLYQLITPYPFAMDIIVYTPEEIAKGKLSSLSFVSNILKEGKILYVRK